MPHHDLDRIKTYKRRTAMLAGGQFLLLSTLVGRLYYLQVLQSDRYVMLADENRINIKLLQPPRGRILDRKGEALAINRLNYRVAMVSEHTQDVTATLDAIASLIPLSERDYKRVLREVRHKRGFVPITVRENLVWDEVAKIEAADYDSIRWRIRPKEGDHLNIEAELYDVEGLVEHARALSGLRKGEGEPG